MSAIIRLEGSLREIVIALRATACRTDPRLATGSNLDALLAERGEERRLFESDATVRTRVFPES